MLDLPLLFAEHAAELEFRRQLSCIRADTEHTWDQDGEPITSVYLKVLSAVARMFRESHESDRTDG